MSCMDVGYVCSCIIHFLTPLWPALVNQTAVSVRKFTSDDVACYTLLAIVPVWLP